jgi:hypothetical protein
MTAIEAGRPAVKGSARRFYTVMAATTTAIVAAMTV